MTEIMMALGDFRFHLGTATYNELEIVHSWRWNKKERANRKPALEYAGPESDTIEMEGTLFPFWKGNGDQIAAMKAEGDKAKPLILVDGLGNVWGKFCIRRVGSRNSKHTVNGQARKKEFSISLIEYGEDES